MCLDLTPSFCFGFSGIVLQFDPFVLFWVLQHRARIRSLRFFSGSPASPPDSIPSFCFKFSGITTEFDPFILFRDLWHHAQFDPFVLFRVLKHHAWIRSFFFLSVSPASCRVFYPFILFQVLRHHAGIRSLRFVSGSLHRARIRSLSFVSGSLTSRSDSIFLFYFGFSSIVLGFDPFLLFRVLRRRAQILLSFLASYSNFPYLPQHCVRASLIFFGIVSEHLLSFPASCPTFIIFFGIVTGFSSSSSASCSSIAYLFRH